MDGSLQVQRLIEGQDMRRMQRSLHWVASLTMAFAMTACGGSDDDEEDELPAVDCGQAIPGFSEVTAFSAVCTECHNSAFIGDDRSDAPVGIDFDAYATATEHAELGAHEVYEGAMPPSDSGLTLTEDQKNTLYLWALCGTPQ